MAMAIIPRLLLACFFCVASAISAVADSPGDEITAANASFAAAINRGDAAAAAAIYAGNAAVFAPDMPRVDGRAGIKAFWQGAIDSKFTDVSLKSTEVETAGDYAYESGNASFSLPGADGAKIPVTVKYFVVWKKSIDGFWQIYRDIWNSNAPAK
jgi:ketosteroid isomerase-like protein